MNLIFSCVSCWKLNKEHKDNVSGVNLVGRVARGNHPLRLSQNRTWISRCIRLLLSSLWFISKSPVNEHAWLTVCEFSQPMCCSLFMESKPLEMTLLPPISSSYKYSWPKGKAEQCHPFAPAPLQHLHHYYGWLRPCTLHRYSDSCRVSAWIAPLTSERQLPKFHISAWTKVMPPLCRMPPDQNSGVRLISPRMMSRSWFWHRLQLSTLLRWFTRVHLLCSYLTELISAFSFNAHHSRSLRMQFKVVWYLRPDRRHRETYSHHWYSMANQSFWLAFLAHRQLAWHSPIQESSVCFLPEALEFWKYKHPSDNLEFYSWVLYCTFRHPKGHYIPGFKAKINL